MLPSIAAFPGMWAAVIVNDYQRRCYNVGDRKRVYATEEMASLGPVKHQDKPATLLQ